MATVPEPVPVADLELVETDGIPLDSNWHRQAMNLLIEVITYLLRGCRDYFVGGNMFIYFNEEQARNRDFRGPDFFYVKGVRWDPRRRFWVIWQEEGRFPNVIIELLSLSTADEDRTTKKAVYEGTFRTPDYFCYDPDTQRLQGWRLHGRRYRKLKPNERGWLWCEELGLWLGTWTGEYQETTTTWPRFFDREGRLVPTEAEAGIQQGHEQRQRAEAGEQRAEAERQRAEAERQRAEAAEAEVARLKARLAKRHQKDNGTSQQE